jgi:hypothetical protein
MRILYIAGCAMALACSRTKTPAKPPARAADRLVGTWRAVEYARGPDDARQYPFGRPPRGYIVYDATGHVFFQVGRSDDSLPRPNVSWDVADSSALARMLRGSAAYFGTYTVDATRGIVTHHIEGEIPPRRANTEIATPFEIRHDTLALSQWLFVRVR